MKTYDAIVIGTGTAGQTAAFDLSQRGKKVAIIEKSDDPGGVCALHGCQSKKYFYEAAEAVARCHHLHGKGIVDVPKSSWQDVLKQKNKFTANIPENTVKKLKQNGVSYYKGEAVFTGPMTLTTGEHEIKGRFVVIAAGSKPAIPPIKGKECMISSREYLALDRLPPRIAFVGGGFIAFEFAHFAARLGASPGHIHIIQSGDAVLKPFDTDMVQALTAASEAEGIRAHTGINVTDLIQKGSQVKVVGKTHETFEVDLVVNATGRQPDIDVMNLEATGVDYSGSGISVDSAMKTSNDAIFAVGDCASSIKLARVADMEAKTAVRSILHQLDQTAFVPMNYNVVPAVLFTHPQLGMVGKTEDQLKNEGVAYKKSTDTELGWPTYRRIGMQHAAYKILADGDGQILGAHFLADNTTGLVNTFAQAMRSGDRVGDIYENGILTPYPSRESDILYMLSPLVEQLSAAT